MQVTIINSKSVNDSILKLKEITSIDSLQEVIAYQVKSLDSITRIVDSIKNTEQQVAIVEKLWGMPVASAAIIISALITISIFTLGYILNWVSEKYERKSELESTKSVITVWVGLLKLPVLQQTKSCRDFAIALRTSTDIQPERFSYNKLLADKLNSIELRELIQIFIINSEGEETDKSKNLFNLVSQIDFLVQVEEKITEAYTVFQKRTFDLMENWNQKLKELDILKNQMTVEIANNNAHPTFALFQHFNNLVNNYVQQFPNGSNVFDSKTTLLDPLQLQTSLFINQNPNDPIAHHLALKIQEINIIYREWQVHFEGNAKIFYDFAIRLVNVYKTLGKVTNQLNERDFKNVLMLN